MHSISLGEMQRSPDDPLLTRVHYELIRGLIDTGACPSMSDLSRSLDLSPDDTRALLADLASIHGVVLHPHVCEPWIIHPFSLTPTINWITNGRFSWWAPCVWCALGVCVIVGGDTRIHTRFGAEQEPLTIEVSDGHLRTGDDVFVHFAIPPSRAWDNVHQHCSLVLPFHSREHIEDWCSRHAMPLGEPVPLRQVADLARVWYGSHASPTWRKWSIAEAQQIFSDVGLTSEFWRLASRDGKF